MVWGCEGELGLHVSMDKIGVESDRSGRMWVVVAELIGGITFPVQEDTMCGQEGTIYGWMSLTSFEAHNQTKTRDPSRSEVKIRGTSI